MAIQPALSMRYDFHQVPWLDLEALTIFKACGLEHGKIVLCGIESLDDRGQRTSARPSHSLLRSMTGALANWAANDNNRFIFPYKSRFEVQERYKRWEAMRLTAMSNV